MNSWFSSRGRSSDHNESNSSPVQALQYQPLQKLHNVVSSNNHLTDSPKSVPPLNLSVPTLTYSHLLNSLLRLIRILRIRQSWFLQPLGIGQYPNWKLNMSSQPLLQTAPGMFYGPVKPIALPIAPSKKCHVAKAFNSKLTTSSTRQKNRPTNPSRTKSLLCQRAHFPIMAELHRYPWSSSNWYAELR